MAAKKAALENAELTSGSPTARPLVARADRPGSIHPVSQVMDELTEIFADLGFSVAEGPEIEDDWA